MRIYLNSFYLDDFTRVPTGHVRSHWDMTAHAKKNKPVEH